MKEIEGRQLTIKISDELAERMDKQRKIEGVTQADFVRRALDRYLLEKEFRGQDTQLSDAVKTSIKENRELLIKLRNS